MTNLWEKFFLPFVAFASVLGLGLLFHNFPVANKFDITTQVLPLALFGAFGAALFVFAAIRTFASSRLERSDFYLFIPVFFYLLFSFIGFYINDFRQFSFNEILVQAAFFGVFFSVRTYLNSKKLEFALLLAVSVLLLVNTFLGIDFFLDSSHQRFFGLFVNLEITADAWPNAYAFFFLFAFAAFCALQVALGRFFRNHKIFYPLLAAFVVLNSFVLSGFFLTASRAGSLAFGVGVIFLLLVSQVWRNLKRIKWVLIPVILTVLLSGVFARLIMEQKNYADNFELEDRFNFSDQTGLNSVNERSEFFAGAIEMFKQRPFFGYGANSFKWVYPQFQKGFLSLSDHAHNVFLKIASEKGVFALMSFVSFLILIFWQSKFWKFETSFEKKIIASGVFAALVHSLVDYNLNFVSAGLVFFAVLALLPKRNAKGNQTGTFGKVFFCALCLVVSGILLASSLKIFRDISTYKSLIGKQQITVEEIVEFKPLITHFSILRLAEYFPEKRLEIYQHHVGINPYDAWVISDIGEIYFRRGDHVKAFEHFKRAFELNPKNSFVNYLRLVKTAKILGKTETVLLLKELVPPLIEEYEALHAINLHFTQKTDELALAKELEKVLGL
jgi:O-antigen ligase